MNILHALKRFCLKKIRTENTRYIYFKGVRALLGYFGPPMRPKNENCFSQVSSY